MCVTVYVYAYNLYIYIYIYVHVHIYASIRVHSYLNFCSMCIVNFAILKLVFVDGAVAS